MASHCPHCGKDNCVPNKVYHHCETYHGHVYHVVCNHCRKMIKVFAQLQVHILSIDKSEKKPSERDF